MTTNKPESRHDDKHWLRHLHGGTAESHTEFLLHGHKRVFSQHPSKRSLQNHIVRLSRIIDELRTELEALRDECERWKRGSEIRDEQNQDLHSFIMELKAECEKLRKDAERYRWLRRGGNDDICVVMGFDGIDCGSTSVAYTYEEGLCGERMDAAIDAAMQASHE